MLLSYSISIPDSVEYYDHASMFSFAIIAVMFTLPFHITLAHEVNIFTLLIVLNSVYVHDFVLGRNN